MWGAVTALYCIVWYGIITYVLSLDIPLTLSAPACNNGLGCTLLTCQVCLFLQSSHNTDHRKPRQSHKEHQQGGKPYKPNAAFEQQASIPCHSQHKKQVQPHTGPGNTPGRDTARKPCGAALESPGNTDGTQTILCLRHPKSAVKQSSTH
jgi:hypothetical protein